MDSSWRIGIGLSPKYICICTVDVLAGMDYLACLLLFFMDNLLYKWTNIESLRIPDPWYFPRGIESY